jgi:hypothetical protein
MATMRIDSGTRNSRRDRTAARSLKGGSVCLTVDPRLSAKVLVGRSTGKGSAHKNSRGRAEEVPARLASNGRYVEQLRSTANHQLAICK